MPVSMRMAPRTPKPGSILVSKRRGSGGAEELADGAALEDTEGVTVTLKTTGMTVLTGMVVRPLVMVVCIVCEAVVRDRETEGVADAPEEGAGVTDELSWAYAVCDRRARRNAAVRTTALDVGRRMSIGGDGDGGEEGGKGSEEDVDGAGRGYIQACICSRREAS